MILYKVCWTGPESCQPSQFGTRSEKLASASWPLPEDSSSLKTTVQSQHFTIRCPHDIFVKYSKFIQHSANSGQDEPIWSMKSHIIFSCIPQHPNYCSPSQNFSQGICSLVEMQTNFLLYFCDQVEMIKKDFKQWEKYVAESTRKLLLPCRYPVILSHPKVAGADE